MIDDLTPLTDAEKWARSFIEWFSLAAGVAFVIFAVWLSI